MIPGKAVGFVKTRNPKGTRGGPQRWFGKDGSAWGVAVVDRGDSKEKSQPIIVDFAHCHHCGFGISGPRARSFAETHTAMHTRGTSLLLPPYVSPYYH